MNRNDFLHALAQVWGESGDGQRAEVVRTGAGDINYVRLFSWNNDGDRQEVSFDVNGTYDVVEPAVIKTIEARYYETPTRGALCNKCWTMAQHRNPADVTINGEDFCLTCVLVYADLTNLHRA